MSPIIEWSTQFQFFNKEPTLSIIGPPCFWSMFREETLQPDVVLMVNKGVACQRRRKSSTICDVRFPAGRRRPTMKLEFNVALLGRQRRWWQHISYCNCGLLVVRQLKATSLAGVLGDNWWLGIVVVDSVVGIRWSEGRILVTRSNDDRCFRRILLGMLCQFPAEGNQLGDNGTNRWRPVAGVLRHGWLEAAM